MMEKNTLFLFTQMLIFLIFSSAASASSSKGDIANYDYIKVKQNKFYKNVDHSNPVSKSLSPSNDKDFMLYKASPGETLMLISFELYTDISKWRAIANDNKDLLERSNKISETVFLKIRKPLRLRKYPKGLPYLIKRRDTLGKVSKKVYGTPRYWNSIYRNNKDQIKDPNIIFAGFTLFYTPKPLIYSKPLAYK